MVHLQHACTHSCVRMVSGNRWESKQCKNFRLCDECYETEKKLEDRERHPINQKDKHTLYQSEIKDYDVCNSCYQKDGASLAERDAQNKEDRQLRVLQLKRMLELLVHASQCRFLHCPYPQYRKVKGLFRHGIQCKIRVSRGCVLCKKMWYLLQLHARVCKVSECHVPRCRFERTYVEPEDAG